MLNYMLDYEQGIKVAAFGEVLLRLKSPGAERFMQSQTLEATFGGAEYNTLASLAQFGIHTRLITQLPKNEIGEAALREIRSFGIDVDYIYRHHARMAQYFLEAGSNQRSGKVIYDRDHSAFQQLNKKQLNWPELFDGCHWFHICGITPALSAELAEHSLEAVKFAKKKGLSVAFDFNYRESLWRNNGLNANNILANIVEHVDVLMASERDCQTCLGVEVQGTSQDTAGRYYNLTEKMFQSFPNLKVMTSTHRDVHSAEHNTISASLRDRDGYYVSRNFDIKNIVDRIGAGDAFAAALIYGLMKNQGGQKALDFASAAACLKHTIPGDINRTSRKEIVGLLGGNFIGQVKR